MKDAFAFLHALYHLARLGYYELALRHVGPVHQDAFELSRRLMHSQLVVDDFLSARKA